MRNIILLNGKVVAPAFTSMQAGHKSFAGGHDAHGPFVACRLDNRADALLNGWYVLVSPEDRPLMERYSWCGHITGGNGYKALVVRRRENIDGKQHDFSLNHEIWERMTGESAEYLHKHGHPLDFRRWAHYLPALKRVAEG